MPKVIRYCAMMYVDIISNEALGNAVKNLLMANMLSEVTKAIAPFKIRMLSGLLHVKAPLIAMTNISEITKAYTDTGICKSPNVGNNIVSMVYK